MIENWNTHHAAFNLSGGITRMLFKNHTPKVSPTNITINAIAECMRNEELNISFILLSFPTPIS